MNEIKSDYTVLCDAVVKIAEQRNEEIRTMDLDKFEERKDKRIKTLVDTYLATTKERVK